MLRGTLVPGGPHPEAWVWIDDSEESVNGVSKWVCGADAWMEWEGFLRCGRRFADGDVGPLDNGDGPRRKSPCAQVGGYDRHDPGLFRRRCEPRQGDDEHRVYLPGNLHGSG